MRLAVVILVVGFLLSAGNTFARGKDSDAESQIHALLDEQAAAWNRGDLSAFMAGYWHSSETTFAGPKGIERGYDAVLDRYRHTYPDRTTMGQLTFSDLEIHILSGKAGVRPGPRQLKRANDTPGGDLHFNSPPLPLMAGASSTITPVPLFHLQPPSRHPTDGGPNALFGRRHDQHAIEAA